MQLLKSGVTSGSLSYSVNFSIFMSLNSTFYYQLAVIFRIYFSDLFFLISIFPGVVCCVSEVYNQRAIIMGPSTVG